jgi:nucleotide-binding universal stress UspA family protein
MFTRVLVPLDRSTLAEEALGSATQIARAAGATLDLVLVHEPQRFVGGRDAPWIPPQTADEECYLAAISNELTEAVEVSGRTLLHGAPAEEICNHAAATGADLIVMTSHGRTGLNRVWLGSVADDVVRRSRTPVLILREAWKSDMGAPVPPRFSKLLVPIDGSTESMEILRSATALARATGARIVLLHVVPPMPLLADPSFPLGFLPTIEDDAATARKVDQAHRWLTSVARTLTDQGVSAVEVHVLLHVSASDGIIGYVRSSNVDAIAMSTHGRGASRLLVGSVADAVRHACKVPILLHRPSTVTTERSLLELDSVVEQLPAMAACGEAARVAPRGADRTVRS